jgi:hypothetical protein
MFFEFTILLNPIIGFPYNLQKLLSILFLLILFINELVKTLFNKLYLETSLNK